MSLNTSGAGRAAELGRVGPGGALHQQDDGGDRRQQHAVEDAQEQHADRGDEGHVELDAG